MLTFGNVMNQNAVKYRNKTAVVFEDTSYTYEELNERGNRLANAFLAQGYKKGDKVAVMMKNNGTYIEIIVGLSKIGVIIVPINFRAVGPEIAYIVEHSESRAYITTPEYVAEYGRIGDVTAQIDTMLVVGETYEAFLQSGALDVPPSDVVETDTMYFGYTSGTTGKPKGVVISHRSRMLTALVTAAEYKIDESDVHAVVGPIYHAAPWIFLMTQLTAGGTIIVEEAYRPEKFLADVQKYGITNTFMAPTMYNFLVNLPEETIKKYDASSLRVFISAGSALPTQTKYKIVEYFPGVDLHEFYGATESAVTLNIKPKDISKDGSVGQPFPFVECIIVDDDKQPVKVGEVGELYFKGPYLLDEYYRNPEATKQAFWNGYFSVGELAMQDTEGYYYIIDRKKDMLISGGVNIYPREIEDVLYHHPDVLEVAVIGVPDPVWGESVQAVVALKEGKTVTEQAIINFCEGRLASYKKPKSVRFVDELPRNPSGKILKVELRSQYAGV